MRYLYHILRATHICHIIYQVEEAKFTTDPHKTFFHYEKTICDCRFRQKKTSGAVGITL